MTNTEDVPSAELFDFGYCDCYECQGSVTAYTDDGHRYVKNNLKKHTLCEPCETCGRPKSEYLDLGRKGYYVCWWCNDRAAGPFGPEAAPPTGMEI